MARNVGYVVLLALPLGTGCADDVTCPAWSFPAVLVRLESATSAAPIIGAVGEVREGGYSDSLFDAQDGSYTAAYDRAGTYTVRLERQGYSPWDTAGVTVRRVGGSCPTVETEILEVRLVPAP
jgi:hypothetical protein